MSFKKISDIELSRFKNDLPIPEVETPDYAQNDPIAKDYIKNRPGGYEEGWEITWDGDTTGRTSMTAEGLPHVWYKVSDNLLTADQVIGGTITLIRNGVSQQMIITDKVFIEAEFGYMVGDIAIFIAAKTGDFNADGLNIRIPEPGVYFLNVSAGGMSLSASSLSNIIARPFDDKYIPDTIARKAELDSRITEKEVILASSTDGSSKKFKITVDDSGAITAAEITDTTSGGN